MLVKSAVAAAGIAGLATLGIGAPAMADHHMPGSPNLEAGRVKVDPYMAHRGQWVTVDIPEKCWYQSGKVTSPAFGAMSYQWNSGDKTVKAKIWKHASYTEHKVTLKCFYERSYDQGSSDGYHTDDQSYKYYYGWVKVKPYPGGGAKTGIGGGADGVNAPLMGAGAALILGAGGAMMIRRRRADAQI